MERITATVVAAISWIAIAHFLSFEAAVMIALATIWATLAYPFPH